jgi:hypothetical protein
MLDVGYLLGNEVRVVLELLHDTSGLLCVGHAAVGEVS